jgi:polar amino acid transport system ATP-binding protein
MASSESSAPILDAFGAAPVATNERVVEITGVHKWFGAVHVLNGVSLSVARGEVLVIIGPSGSGKTTLLRCINFLERYDDGRILVNGELVGYRETSDKLVLEREKVVAQQRRHTGMVFQRFNLFAHKTALGNVTEALVHVQGLSPNTASELSLDLLSRVGLRERAHAYPSQLSGGQQQRVAICRALALRPAVMLFDEPTSALDPETTGEVLSVMAELAAERMTMIVVTHEIGFARRAADRVVMMEDGAIVEEGIPSEILDDPSHPRTKAFLSKVAS